MEREGRKQEYEGYVFGAPTNALEDPFGAASVTTLTAAMTVRFRRWQLFKAHCRAWWKARHGPVVGELGLWSPWRYQKSGLGGNAHDRRVHFRAAFLGMLEANAAWWLHPVGEA